VIWAAVVMSSAIEWVVWAADDLLWKYVVVPSFLWLEWWYSTHKCKVPQTDDLGNSPSWLFLKRNFRIFCGELMVKVWNMVRKCVRLQFLLRGT
jgi:hypothetical protein